MFITKNTRESIVKLLNGIGLIAIILGIFSKTIEFGLGAVIGVFFWMSADVFRTWVKIDKINQKNIFQTGKAFSKLLTVFGVSVLIFSIFLETLSFNIAIVIAVSLFIISGVFSEFFGGGKSSKYRKRHVTTTPINSSFEFKSGTGETDYFNEGPAKRSCQNCGNPLEKGDLFCAVCGEKIS